MSWQDLVLSVGTVTLALGLLPSVLSPHKPALRTSVVTGLSLTSFAIVYISLDLWFSALFTAISAVLWYIMAVQRMNKKRKEES